MAYTHRFFQSFPKKEQTERRQSATGTQKKQPEIVPNEITHRNTFPFL